MTANGKRRLRFRLSIRYKLLALNAVLLLLSVGLYLYLATSLFAKDKLAYVFDLQSSLVETLTEQTFANVKLLEERLGHFASRVDSPEFDVEKRTQAATELFSEEGDMLRVQVYGVDGDTATLRHAFVNRSGLDDMNLKPRDLEETTKERALPLVATAAANSGPLLRNSSLPPDAAILTLVIAYDGPAGRGTVVADFSHQRLLRLFGRSKIHKTMLLDQRGQVVAHPDPEQVIARADLSSHPVLVAARASGSIRGVKEFEVDGERILGAWGEVDIAGLAVVTEIPRKTALTANQELVRRSSRFAIAIVLVTFIVMVVFSRFFTAPLRRLSHAIDRIGEGDLDVKVETNSSDEIGDLARAFSAMTSRLKETQAQLVHSEKMSAFGQLGAGITHELRNPIAGIVGLAQTARRKLDKTELVDEFLGLIEKESHRCLELLNNFLVFARKEDHVVAPLPINELVEGAIKLVRHQLNVKNVTVVAELAPDGPTVMASPSVLQQVITNLAINAQQAMPNGGTVTVTTGRNEAGGFFSLADTGTGIAPEHLQRIFEPFFTTKAAGEGTGLGLSVTFSLIQQLGGSINVDTEVGKGTTVTITLPLADDG